MRKSLILGSAMWLALAAGFPAAVCAGGVGGLALPVGSAGSVAPAKSPAEIDSATVATALAAAEADLQKITEDGGAVPAGATQEELLERNHLSRHLVDTLIRHSEALERLPEARRRGDERQKEEKSWTGFALPPPYSLLLVDQLREALGTVTVEIQAATTRRTMMDEEAGEAEKRFKAAEVLSRQSEERLSMETSVEGRNRQTWLHDLARLRGRIAVEDISEAQTQAALADADETMKRAEAHLLETQLGQARKSVRFSQSDLDDVLIAIDRQRAQLEERAKRLNEAAAAVHQEVERAQQALAEARAQLPKATEAPAQRAARLAVLAQWAELRQRQSDNHDLAVESVQRLLELQNWERTGWQYRWHLFNGSDSDKVPEARALLDQRIAQLESWSRYVEREIELSNGRIGEFELRQKGMLSAAEADLALRFIAAERDRTEVLRSAQQAMENFRRTLMVWREEFVSGADDRSVGGVAEAWAKAVRRGIQAFWNFELFSAEDSLDIDGRKIVATRSITIGKSLGVVLLLLAGYLLSGWALRGIRRLAVGHLGLNAGPTNTVLRWLHFSLLSMLFIVALYMANIPLTVFAFLGGALAIGVGFGTQVLLKNMISGVMLLVERPLRIGDMVEVGAVVGTVTNISIRSSTVRTSDGIEILVPNSTFIENNVTNWTYSNAKVRRSVSVGVDYAAAPERVSEVLLAVARDHPHVVADPPPRVLLEDFGADSMGFKLQYWIDYGQGADGSLIASQLRVAMARALAAAGIGIPFPQRVVYLKKEDDPPVEGAVAPHEG